MPITKGLLGAAAAAALFPAVCAGDPPAGFVDLKVASGWEQVAGLGFPPVGGLDMRLFVWEKSGIVWNVENGVRNPSPLIDLHEEVGDWVDHGLVGFAVDPNFWSNGFIYLFYVVDYHHLVYFGTPQYDPDYSELYHDTIGRITRYTCNVGDGFRSVDYNSRLVLLGETITTGIPILQISHGVGTLLFGEDGMLIASCGDGSSHENLDIGGPRPDSSNTGLADGIIKPKEDVGAYRCQMVDSLSGKILRLNPVNGDGVSSNPHYSAAATRAAKSRVYAVGVRNPYRMSLRPGTGNPDPAAGNPGTLLFGDVGWETKEELNVCTQAGQNFGWPIYEGLTLTENYNFGFSTANVKNLDAPNPLAGGSCPSHFYFRQLIIQDTLAPSFPNPCNGSQQIPANIPHWVHRRPQAEWDHDGDPARVPIYVGNNAGTANIGAPGSPVQGVQAGGNCATGGVWYTGTSFPAMYHNTYFYGDFGHQWIRNLVFDSSTNLTTVRNFLPDDDARVTCIALHPVTGDLYYVNYEADQFNRAEVHRVVYPGSNNLPPVAVAASDVTYGPTPLTVHFTGDDSSDPEGLPLTYRWDFGDGAVSLEANPVHTYTNEVDIAGQGTIVAKIFSLDPPYPTGQGSLDAETIRDGDVPPVGTQNWLRQFDTFHDGQQGSDDWVGYTFPQAKMISGVVFQEGLFDAGTGGWWQTVNIEVKIGSNWQQVTGQTITPAYSGNNGVSFETFTFRFNPVSATGVRIRGNPGGNDDFFSIGELRVLSPAPEGSGPRCHTAVLTVTDDVGASTAAQLVISPNNTPPVVLVTSPVAGVPFTTAYSQVIPLQATISDAQSSNGLLTCRWQTIIRHGNHNHPEPPVNSCSSSAEIGPHGVTCGDFFYEFQLVVTDPHCLSTGVSVILYPNCCKPDYNNDGFVDGIDYDGFMNAFEVGGPTADYNNDGFVDGIDSDWFTNDFEVGCP